MTLNLWHVTSDTWHGTHDMRHMVGGELSLWRFLMVIKRSVYRFSKNTEVLGLDITQKERNTWVGLLLPFSIENYISFISYRLSRVNILLWLKKLLPSSGKSWRSAAILNLWVYSKDVRSHLKLHLYNTKQKLARHFWTEY